MCTSAPKLAAVVVVGARRDRAQRCVDALCGQSAAGEMEIVVVDTAAADSPELRMSGPSIHLLVPMPRDTTWGEARYQGFLRSRAPIVAFIEDHCFAEEHWARTLIDVYKSGEWAAVGYGQKNANPKTHVSRVSMLLDYGPWQLPTTSRRTELLPGNNVSYRRDDIAPFGNELKSLLEIDYNLQTEMRRRNKSLYVAAEAVAAHQNFEYLRGACNANFAYARVLASNRARINAWSIPLRLFYACGTPLVSPPIRLHRLIKSFAFSPTSAERSISLSKTLPMLLITFAWSAIGEALGYLLGEGRAGRDLFYWEVEAKRTKDVDAV